jgi:hypothetical protein
MGVEDLVRLNVFSLYPADVFMVSSGHQEILAAIAGVAYLAVSGLVSPEFLVEIDAVVCKVDYATSRRIGSVAAQMGVWLV